jgi:hypothetical protein
MGPHNAVPDFQHLSGTILHPSKLEQEIQILKLFDLGWTTQEVSFKLDISNKESYERFKEWGKLRRQRQAVQHELVKRCLQRHICSLQEHVHWRATKSSLDEAKSQLERCRSLMSDPSKLTEAERTFLITEYSYLL